MMRVQAFIKSVQTRVQLYIDSDWLMTLIFRPWCQWGGISYCFVSSLYRLHWNTNILSSFTWNVQINKRQWPYFKQARTTILKLFVYKFLTSSVKETDHYIVTTIMLQDVDETQQPKVAPLPIVINHSISDIIKSVLRACIARGLIDDGFGSEIWNWNYYMWTTSSMYKG